VSTCIIYEIIQSGTYFLCRVCVKGHLSRSKDVGYLSKLSRSISRRLPVPLWQAQSVCWVSNEAKLSPPSFSQSIKARVLKARYPIEKREPCLTGGHTAFTSLTITLDKWLWVPPITYWFQPSLDDTIHQLEPTPSPGIDRPTRLSFVPATYPPIDSYPTLLLTYRLSQEDEGQH